MASTKHTGDVPTSFEIDVAALSVEQVSELAEAIDHFHKRLAALTPDERAAYDEECRAEEEASDRRGAETEKRLADYEGALVARHEEIERDRVYGLIGTQTEIGRPFGLTAVAVGKILDTHGLRERVEVECDGPHGRSILRLPSGVRDGYAVHDHFNGRDYWIRERIAPLLEPHAKRR